MSRVRAGVLVVAMLALGCEVSPVMTGRADGGATADAGQTSPPDTDPAPDVMPTDRSTLDVMEPDAAEPDAIAAPAPDSDPTDSMAPPETGPAPDAGPTPDTQGPDSAPPAVPGCSSSDPWRVDPCGHVGGYNMCGGYSWVPLWKDGRECAICHAGSNQRTGCTMPGNADECTGQDREPLLCVAGCNECQER